MKNYVIGADLLRREVKATRLGDVKGVQSFCLYNDKYYSTDGKHMYVQDREFRLLEEKELDVGHGNALQLGCSHYAYASGWDDQKVYVVDLDTLSISEVIDLGTTGYTTCAVDDLNGIIYIFQRDSYPTSIVHYNFIRYDLKARKVLSTRRINAFSAMQACDFYNGKIAVGWGLGTEASPSGMAIYNSEGDILAEYHLEIYEHNEPEGICFDRKNKTLLHAMLRTVYEITAV